MSILKRKKKVKDVVEEPVTEVTEVQDEDIQTTFNDDQEGLFEDVVFIKKEDDLEKEEAEREDN